ncbi:hypothetical protein KEM52_001349 [Ascosphaera acerosa]|nr:hypothetical protein KEM52_001349 [Ascosphaera acerosa]
MAGDQGDYYDGHVDHDTLLEEHGAMDEQTADIYYSADDEDRQLEALGLEPLCDVDEGHATQDQN